MTVLAPGGWAEATPHKLTCEAVNFVQEDDGGSSCPGQLECGSQKGLPLPHIHAEQLCTGQGKQGGSASSCCCSGQSCLAAPCTALRTVLTSLHPGKLTWDAGQRKQQEAWLAVAAAWATPSMVCSLLHRSKHKTLTRAVLLQPALRRTQVGSKHRLL